MIKQLFLVVLGLASFSSTVNHDQSSLSKPSQKVQHSFLFISDLHVISGDDNYASPGEDVSMPLFNQFISKTTAVLKSTPALDFILCTGDLPAHTGPAGPINPGYIPGHDSDLVTGLRGLLQIANSQPNIPLFYLPGNNDSESGDYYPFSNSNGSPFRLLNEKNNPFPALNVNRFAKQVPCLVDFGDTAFCYYSARPVKGLRLIAMNTVLYTTGFLSYAGKNATVAGDKQMNWLSAELADAKAKLEKVYIAMHVPPRYIDYKTYRAESYGWTKKMRPGNGMNSYIDWFYSLTGQYKDDCIEAVLYGHTHMDELYLLKQNGTNQNMGVAVSCPGISHNHGNNSGFKTVQYDSASKSLLDFTTYYTNPVSGEKNWGTRSYSFSNIFGSDPLNQTIFEKLSGMPDQAIAAAVKNIYKVNPR
jgi:hypothetical protein